MTDTGNLRNEDFRRLLAEKKPSGVPETPSRESGPSFSHKAKPKEEQKKKGGHGHAHKHKKDRRSKGDERGSDEEDANLKDILKNYRDRAAERRKVGDEGADDDRLTVAYRAVPGDPRAAADAAEKRKQAIQESKYLGGDMEHTHLVKGLDYSLLNKVRSEIAKTVTEIADDDLDKAYISKEHAVETIKDSDNKMVRNINRSLFKEELPVRNELFGKGRMAYVVEMEEEDAEIPTTLLRSVHDCPIQESNATINTNNMLISKLTQVLAYLRTDNKKKKKGVEMAEEERAKHKNDSIYENEGEYVSKRDKEDKRDRKEDRGDRKDRDYFDRRDRDRRDRRDDRDRHRERDHDRERERDRRDTREHREREKEKRDEREKERDREKKDRDNRERQEKEKKLEEKLEKRKKETEGYDECYPGGMAEMGGGWDSDEEDFSKMDGSAKKGPIKRWDFEHEEDYEKYQGQREAMPKAAYQFGVKTSDGRKTRKSASNENGDKKLDRELDKINRIMEKRKQGGGSEDHGDFKRPKY